MLERKLAIIIGSLFALLVLPAAAACAGGDGAKGDQPETTPSATAETTPRAEPSSSANITPPALTPGSGEGPEPSGTIAFISFRDGDRAYRPSLCIDLFPGDAVDILADGIHSAGRRGAGRGV